MKVTQPKGQALSELMVAMSFIVPMLLLVPVLANYLDVQTATHEAGRYMAWERTVRNDLSSNALSQEISEHFLEGEGVGFSVAQPVATGERWRDFGAEALSERTSVVDSNDSVALTDWEATGLPTPDPARENVATDQFAADDALGVNSVSIPLRSDSSLYDGLDAPDDLINGSQRFHTRSTSALLASGGVVPLNEAEFKAQMDNVVRHDDQALNIVQSPLRLARWAGLQEVTQILTYDPDRKNAVPAEQSMMLPDGLLEE